MTTRSVVTRFEAQIAGYQAAMAQMRASTQAMSREVGQAARANKAEFTQMGTAMAASGAAMALGFGKVVSASANFQKAMAGVRSVSNASVQEMERLSESAKAAGADVDLAGVTASSAAQAQMELVKAGVSVSDVMGGALKGSLSLAVAGQLDMADAATIAAQSMNLFKLEGSDVGHVADVMAAAANKSAADVSQLGQALRQGGLLAAQTGLSLEETVGTLAAFADRALIGSDAGTSLKTMLQRLTPQSAEAKKQMMALGFSAFDASGEFVGMAELAGRLQTSLGGMSTEQRNAAMNVMFGSDAVRGANVLLGLGSKGVANYTAAVNDQGAATRMAAIQTDSLSGDIEALGGAVESLMIDFGDNAQGPLRKFTQGLTGIVNGLANLPEGAQSATMLIGGLTSAITLAGGGFLLAAPRIAETRDALKKLAVEMPRTHAAFRGMGTFLTGPWGIALAAATAGLIYYAQKKGEAAARTEALIATLDEESGALTGESRAMVYSNLVKEGAVDLANKMGVSLRDLTDAAMGNADAQGRVNLALQEYRRAQGGTATSLGEVVELNNAIGAQRDAVEATSEAWREKQRAINGALEGSGAHWRMAELADAAAAGLDTFGDAAAGATPKVTELTKAQEAFEDTLSGFFSPLGAYTDTLAAKEAKERETAEATAAATESSKDSWEDYARDVKVSLDEYMDALQDQVDAHRDWEANMLSLALRVSDGTLEYLSRLGPEGAPLVADLVDASDKELRRFERLARRTGENVPSELRDRFEAATPVLRKVAEVLGKGAADGMAEQLRKGTTTVGQIVGQYGWMLAQGINPILVGVGKSAIAVSAGSGAHWRAVENLHSKNAGGLLPGGGPDRDSLLAYLTPGEFVTRRRAVKYYGTDLFERLNRMELPREAIRRNAGGWVTPDDVAKPPSVSAYGNVVGHTGRSVMEHARDAVTEWIATNSWAALGGKALAKVRAAMQGIPGLQITSTYRPGAITASGNVSYHADRDDPAVDVWAPTPGPLDALYARLVQTKYRELLWRVPNHAPGDNMHLHYANAGGLVPLNVGSYDHGGWLQPGWNLAHNGLGVPEPVGFNIGGSVLGTRLTESLGTRLVHGQNLNPAPAMSSLPNPARVARIVAQARGGSSEDIADAIKEIEDLIAAWNKAAEAEEQAARRGELVRARNRAQRKVDRADTKKERRQANDELDEAIAALEQFDDAARRSAREQRVNDQLARLQAREQRVAEREEARERRAENIAEWRFSNMTTDQQIADVRRRLEAERRGSDEWLRLKQQERNLQEEINRERADALAALERAQQDAFESLNRMLDQYAAVQARRASVLEQHSKSLADAERKFAADQVALAERRNEQLVNLARDLVNAESQILRERSDKLGQWFRASEQAVVQWGNSAGSLIRNAQEQLALFDEWAAGVDQLRARGLSEGAIGALGLDDPSQLGQVRALLNASAGDLATYNQLVAKQQAAANARTAAEQRRSVGEVGRALADAQRDHAAKVAQVHADYSRGLADLRRTHNEAVARLHAELTASMTQLDADLKAIGQQQGRNYAEALAAGIASGLPAIVAAVQAVQMATLRLGAGTAAGMVGSVTPGAHQTLLDRLANRVPRMATGGWVTSPTMALIGEAGPEAVLPPSTLNGWAELIVSAIHLADDHDRQRASRLYDLLDRGAHVDDVNFRGLRAVFGEGFDDLIATIQRPTPVIVTPSPGGGTVVVTPGGATTLPPGFGIPGLSGNAGDVWNPQIPANMPTTGSAWRAGSIQDLIARYPHIPAWMFTDPASQGNYSTTQPSNMLPTYWATGIHGPMFPEPRPYNQAEAFRNIPGLENIKTGRNLVGKPALREYYENTKDEYLANHPEHLFWRWWEYEWQMPMPTTVAGRLAVLSDDWTYVGPTGWGYGVAVSGGKKHTFGSEGAKKLVDRIMSGELVNASGMDPRLALTKMVDTTGLPWQAMSQATLQAAQVTSNPLAQFAGFSQAPVIVPINVIINGETVYSSVVSRLASDNRAIEVQTGGASW